LLAEPFGTRHSSQGNGDTHPAFHHLGLEFQDNRLYSKATQVAPTSLANSHGGGELSGCRTGPTRCRQTKAHEPELGPGSGAEAHVAATRAKRHIMEPGRHPGSRVSFQRTPTAPPSRLDAPRAATALPSASAPLLPHKCTSGTAPPPAPELPSLHVKRQTNRTRLHCHPSFDGLSPPLAAATAGRAPERRGEEEGSWSLQSHPHSTKYVNVGSFMYYILFDF
jgi:hypothetical protein